MTQRTTGWVRAHFESRQVARIIYGAIIGLSLIIVLQTDPPNSVGVIVELLGTAIAVSLAELFSEYIGVETSMRRRIEPAEWRMIGGNAAAVAVGISFPIVFFVLAVAGAIEESTAFTLAKWTGLALTGFYGFVAARFAGRGLLVALAQATAIAAIGAMLIGLKALVH